MRSVLVIGGLLVLGACSMTPQAPPVVSWQYGAGNGDGVSYPGPKPTFNRAYGAGNGDGVQSGQTATTKYSYGADGMSGTMVQVAPTPPTVVAARRCA